MVDVHENPKSILILLGYDYIPVLVDLVKDSNIFCLILESDKQYFNVENLCLLKEIMGDRLYEQDLKSNDVLKVISINKIDTLITFGWRRLLNVDEYTKLDYLINIHPALLPEYKGYHPVPFVIMNEENKHGITAHLITSEMDAGDIVLRQSFNINPFSTLKSLQDGVMKLMPSFLHELFEIIKNNLINPTDNDDCKTIVKAPRRKPEDSRVELSDTLDEVFKNIKASDPNRFPVYFEYMGERVYISMWRDKNVKRQNKFDI